MMWFNYYDLRKAAKSENIDLIFPDWDSGKERVAIFSPHDDDALLGAGYLIQAVAGNGGEPFVFIFCNGNAGYSTPEDRGVIVARRKGETKSAYAELGLGAGNVIRLDYPDFSVLPNIGWMMPWGEEGSFVNIIKNLRNLKITRLVIPNRYREHIDHESVGRIGAFDGPQVGDEILVDWGKPVRIKSFLEYAVWGDFSPEDALVAGGDISIRANRAIKAPPPAEAKVAAALSKFESQQRIIKGLLEARKERQCRDSGDGYIELYIDFDPRPTLRYDPYRTFISSIDNKY
ncbi:MAG: PIG-L family deacetylase [Firmicutes bacterium]|nr:PIG-L family deacetylase [Bacillota bacterium]